MNNDIKGYRCPNCGSMIPISSGRVLKCECCGSEFEKEHKDIQRIYTTNIDGEDVLIGTRIYGYEMECFKADPEGFLEYKLNDMAHKLAESILPHISIDVSEDLMGSSSGNLQPHGKRSYCRGQAYPKAPLRLHPGDNNQRQKGFCIRI